MMKRTIPLLVAVAFVLSVAPAALADHCVRCKISQTYDCLWGSNFGRTDCVSDGFSCTLSGPTCSHSLAAVTPLAAEYTVASVQRLDEPQKSADEKLVATLETPQPTTR